MFGHANRARKATPRHAPHRQWPSLRGLQLQCLEERLALTNLPPGFTESLVAGGLTSPTSMAEAPDGRIFVTEQAGHVRVIKNNALLPTPFLSLAVNSEGERGLLGLAFDPNFANNQFVYVYYTTSTSPIHNRVSRFTAHGDVVLPGSEVQLLNLENLGASNHNGGAMHFGMDGKLYISVGENGVPSNSQTLDNRLGKMLRINADGSIPTDNPFFSSATGDNRSIWALGLRNPFTFAVQPGSGRVYINDVGQGTWEEINNGVAGGNYGWPSTEGPTSNPAFISPVFAYPNGDGVNEGRAIAGGAFYNPQTPSFPAEYQGDYFFADFAGLFIRRLDPVSGVVSDFASATPFGTVDVDVGRNGSVLYLSRGAGAVMRIQVTTNGPPLVVSGGPGMQPEVRVLDAATGIEQASFLAYAAAFTGGVRVATGDVNLDGVQDMITSPGPGGGPHVRVFDGSRPGQVLREFYAYNPQFSGGVFVAAGDFDGDGRADIVTAAGAGGGPHVKVFRGDTGALLGEFYAYHPTFGGGVHVAVGDVDGTGGPDIITGAGAGGGPHVRIFRNPQGQENASVPGMYAYAPAFGGGVFVAAADVAGDGRAEIITGAGPGGGPHVRVFNQSLAVISEFYAYHPAFGGGVRVSAMNLTGDARMEVVTAAGAGGGPHVKVFSIPSAVEVAGFYAFRADFPGGVFAAGSRLPASSGFSSMGAPPTELQGVNARKSLATAPAASTRSAASGPEIVDQFWTEFEDIDSAVLPDSAEQPLDAVACALCLAIE